MQCTMDIFPLYHNVIPGKYVAYAFSYTGGALIQWCVDNLAKDEKRAATDKDMSVNEYLEKKYAEERGEENPSNLLILPHFAGAGNTLYGHRIQRSNPRTDD